MPVPIKNTKILYYSVPKVACTSIKTALHQLNTGSTHLPEETTIHRLYQSRILRPDKPMRDNGIGRVAVIRDPLKRLLSCYSNRVLHHRELSLGASNSAVHEALNLPYNPDVNTFLLRIEDYCRASRPITHHVAGFQWYLGNDLSKFAHLFKQEQLTEFEDLVESLTGENFSLPRLETGGRKVTPDDLSEEALNAALRFCRHDYEFLKGRYSADSYGGIPEGQPEDPSSLQTPYGVYNGNRINPSFRKQLSIMVRKGPSALRKFYVNE
ncbi:sulfotransferase family 2 domain-containing protein [Flexibacterium corallicola]|uniref:sulfotransferase family 2 domain-containing protein n=1 Tax=Flexibacterium corallicola TaxID=3037259 RepID=UPI00286EF6FF|nr:sulfotransferase family 2 domain-containing protein [Pseudovibrio sp. M1P-2-3]